MAVFSVTIQSVINPVLNKRLGEIIPAEGDMITTNIVHSFSMDDITGIPVETGDILETYATHAEDSLFWQEHSAILPDSVIIRSIENYRQRNEVVIKDSVEYEAYLKRLYTPHISLMASSGLMDDFSFFHYNSNSLNRYMSSLFQRNLRGVLRQQLGIYLYTTFVAIPVDEVIPEWMLLNRRGIGARIYPFAYNKYNASYLYGVDDQLLSDFKNENYGDFMRLHTVRHESHYVKSNMIEEELAKVDLSNKNNRFDYLQLYFMELLSHRGVNVYNPFKKEIKASGDISDVKQPLIVDRNWSWVKYLFDPDAEYLRHVGNSDLTGQERKYLKRSSYWSWLNLLSPQMYGIPKFSLGNRNSFTFSLNYLRIPFGEQFGQNIWIMHNYSQLHGVFLKQYRNFEKTTFGIGYKLYDLKLCRNAYVTTSLDCWQQPTGFRFMANSSFTGFHVSQLFEYRFLPDKYVERNNFSLFVGYDYKTKGYMPESFFLDNNFNIKAGFKVNVR